MFSSQVWRECMITGYYIASISLDALFKWLNYNFVTHDAYENNTSDYEYYDNGGSDGGEVKKKILIIIIYASRHGIGVSTHMTTMRTG